MHLIKIFMLLANADSSIADLQITDILNLHFNNFCIGKSRHLFLFQTVKLEGTNDNTADSKKTLME